MKSGSIFARLDARSCLAVVGVALLSACSASTQADTSSTSEALTSSLTIVGALDAPTIVQTAAGTTTVTVSGWSCGVGNPDPIHEPLYIDLYLGTSKTIGTLYAIQLAPGETGFGANTSTEAAAMESTCQTPGFASYRFLHTATFATSDFEAHYNPIGLHTFAFGVNRQNTANSNLINQAIAVQSASSLVESADLSNMNLAGINLSKVNLTGTNFTNATLTGANLVGAKITPSTVFASSLSRTALDNISASPGVLSCYLEAVGALGEFVYNQTETDCFTTPINQTTLHGYAGGRVIASYGIGPYTSAEAYLN
jgi:hypothetical protein